MRPEVQTAAERAFRRWGPLQLVGFLACASSPMAGPPATTHGHETARDLALDTPCELAAAIFGAGLRFGAGPKQARWRATVGAPPADDAGLSRLPLLVVLEPDGRELVGWGKTCPNGLGGPRIVVGGTVDFYAAEVTVRDSTTLTFEVSARYVEFDQKGRKLHDVVQGGVALVGEVSLLPSRADQRAVGDAPK